MTRPGPSDAIQSDLRRPQPWLRVLALLLPLVAGCSPMSNEPSPHEPPPHEGMN